MSSSPGITLTFSCTQDWNEMQQTCNGRFCSTCNKEVLDFTTHSISQIRRIKNEQGAICGMFRPEQLEPDLVPVQLNFLQKARYFIFTAAAFLGLELSQAAAQVKSPQQTENTLDTCRDQVEAVLNDMKDSAVVIKSPAVKEKKYRSHTLLRVGRFHVYRSKRFPFIHLRTRRIMGRIAF